MGNSVTGIRWSRRKSMTAGSRTIPSSIVKNTTGLEVGTREMIGATDPPWIGTGVGAGSGVVVVVVVVDADVEVVAEPLDVRCSRDRAARAACPLDVNDPANPQVPRAPTATTMMPASTLRLRLDAACRRIRRSITHGLSPPTASSGC
jgi:hypothetical protein